MSEIRIPPHADVRNVIRDLGTMRGVFLGMGLETPNLDAAIEMLTDQSFEIEEWRSGKRKQGPTNSADFI